MPISERHGKILDFLILADRMKQIERHEYVGNTTRRENDAEHCFHMALCLLVLQKEIGFEVDLSRALSLVLVHDLVEIYAGDTFAYDATAVVGQQVREQEAAQRLFGTELPTDTGIHLRELWDEFEAKETNESRLANACDRLQGFLQGIITDGRAVREHNVTREQTLLRTDLTRTTDPVFAELLDEIYRRADEAKIWQSTEGDTMQPTQGYPVAPIQLGKLAPSG